MFSTLGLVARLVAPAEATPEVALEWPEIAGCPSRDEVVAAALRMIAGDAPRSVRAAATLRQGEAGWTLELTVEGEAGAQRRVLSSASCAGLGEAAAVILAVAARPQAVVPVAPAPVAPMVAPDPLDEGPPPAVAAAERPTRARPQAGVFVQAGAGLGPTPRMVAGFVAGAAVVWPRVRVEARATYWTRAALRLPELPEVGADLRLATGGLRGCPVLVRRSLGLQVCAGVELGATIVAAVNLAEDLGRRSLWAAGLIAPGVRWRPRRWVGLGLEVEAVVPMRRRQYVVADVSEPLATTPALGVRVLAGVEFNFP